MCVLQVHFQQSPIPGLPSDTLTVGQTLEHLRINLLKSGAWICFQIAIIPEKQCRKSESSIHHIAIEAGGCSQDSNPTCYRPLTQFLGVLKLTLQINEMKKELWFQSAKQSKTRVVLVRMEMQAIHRNQAHIYPIPVKQPIHGHIQTFPAVIEDNRSSTFR